jgi:hypothetical protein
MSTTHGSARRPATQAAQVRPYWVPEGLDPNRLPAEMKAAINGILNSAYERLVLRAADGLERSTGATIVHLLWLEVLDQMRLGQGFEDACRSECPSEDRRQLIECHLRLVGAKFKASGFWLRLQQFRERWGRHPDGPNPLAPPIEPPGGWPDHHEED